MKNTKIIATVSDLKCDIPFLKELVKNGVNIIRLNTAHQTIEDTLGCVKKIRTVSNKIPIIIDTKGPEIRTTPLLTDPIEVKRGDKIIFRGDVSKKTSNACIYVNYNKFARDVSSGSHILYDDGEIEFVVKRKKKDSLICEVLNDGTIKGKKSLNVPGISMDLPSLTKKDKNYVEFCIKHKIDFIAHSFIRNKEDLLEVQKILDKKNSKVKLIAKIENQEGVDNIDEILEHCAGVMVARGDLAIEIPAQKVPPIQKAIIDKCVKKRKIGITATQMLHTMIENPRPTRAEISDIANAIYDGTDCIMLSGETAYGKYPIESVKVMTKVANEVEMHKDPIKRIAVETMGEGIHSFLAKSAVRATIRLPIKAILTDTLTGRTAKYLSAFKGRANIYALSYDERVMRELAFSYGVYADSVKREINPTTVFKRKIRDLISKKLLKRDDMIVILSGSFGATHGASKVEISMAGNFLK
ncbi:pyruvate kinase [Candidatus Pacearchaeota archaeon]|nr:pyruvate kinase [Candidatus Pacearchaeota archaeon]